MSELQLIAHNLRSRENVGSLFRTCDSLGVAKLWLTGYTPTPPDGKISKVALGAERVVSWEAQISIEQVFATLAREKIPVYALEMTAIAVDLKDFAAPQRLALLLGTETTGIPPSLIDLCTGAVKIAQKGIKESMNVAVAAGIASWAVLQSRNTHHVAMDAQEATFDT